MPHGSPTPTGREQLARLLARREDTAVSMYRMLSHGLSDLGGALLERLLVIESEILALSPATYRAQHRTWQRVEDTAIHVPGEVGRLAGCPLCVLERYADEPAAESTA